MMYGKESEGSDKHEMEGMKGFWEHMSEDKKKDVHKKPNWILR